MNKVIISNKDITDALVPSVWDLGNNVLYELCKNNPKHESDEAIIAKIWLIGRAYAAAIERRKNAKVTSDDFYENTIVNEIKKSKVDEWLANLPDQIANPWEQVSSAITAHKRLMDLFKR